MLRNRLRQPLAKWVLVVLSLVPFAYLCAGVYFDSLGPNPAEYLIRASGDLTLRFLCITLLITPLRIITRPSDKAIVWRWDSPEAYGGAAANQNPNGLGACGQHQLAVAEYAA